jgi:Zn-dependent metalloprotease
MKNTIKNILKTIIILLGFNVPNLFAQNNQLEILESEYNNSGQLFYIAPHPSWDKTPLDNLPELLSKAYGISSNFTFKLLSEDIEEKFTFTRVDQMIGNHPVVGGDMIFKRDKTGKLLSIIGIPRDPVSITIPVKTSEEALVIAEKSLNISKKDYFMASAGDSLASKPIIELKYAPIGGILNNKVTLCYEIIIYSQTPIGQWYIYVNATNGHIEYKYNALPHANGTGNSLYSGNNKSINTFQGASEYFLFDTDRNIMTSTWLSTSDITKRRVITDATNTFDTVEQKPGVDVHWGMALVYDYFLNVHGRKSYDGKGTIIKNNVRFHMTDGPNAFFSNDPTWIGMYYSEGNNARWSDVVALDVVGHELSHAVVSRSARLIYQGESGALDESFADIFGHNIEMTGKASNWLMGEECFTPNSAGDNLRDLSNPNNSGDASGNGKCPDTYKGTHWKSTSDAFDDGGVHFNSGVQNYWYYLLTVGGNGTNDAPLNHQFAVTGIGQQKSEKIVYRNLTRYLGSSSDYKAARKGALLAAEDLYGKNSNEYQQVCNAWYAVGVGEKCCKGDDSLVFTFKVTDTKCHDSEDGEIELTVKNKKGDPITLCQYEWYKNDTNNVLLADSRNIINLDSGKYVVIVKDTVNHCESFDKTEVKSPEELKASVSGGGTFVVPCQRSFTINLTASASGGKTPYTFNWPNAIKEVVLTGSGGSSQIYTATVTDKNGCPAEKSAIVTYIPIVCSYDPNEIVGPPSYSDNKWVSINATLPYKIRYENDPKFATGPAQKVTISHMLDSNTDLTSFRLSSFGFYKYSFDVPDNSSTYSKRLDLRDSFGIFLDVTAGLDIDNKEAFWIFESIDPATGLPPADGTKGYLAVNDTITHKGEGFVNYTIKAKSTAKTGDSIRAKATIVFDDNPPVPTPRIFNLIDAKPPTSYIKSVASLIDSAIVPLTLRGKDDTGGSGLGNFDVYVSENGGAYNIFAKEIADTLINFRGNYGSTYTAYSIASDNVDNREGDKTSAEITFSIASNEFFKPITPGTSLCTGDTLNIRWLRSFVNSVNLQYSADSGKSFTTFATNLGGIDTLYRWKIPGTISGIKKYILRSVNASNSVIIDTSDYFELKQGPVISLGTDTSFCDGTSFSLTLNPGSGYTTYKWSDSTTNTTKTVSNYGNYWVQVTASTGCKSTDQILVSKDLLPVVSNKSLTSPLCFGNSNGAINITVVSGTAPYTYLWNNSATTQDLTNIVAGNYSVSITDKKGCNIIDATNLTQPSQLAKSKTITNVKCFGGNDGSVNETISGGTTPYSYAWSSGSTSEDISSIVAGTYYLEVTDKNSCTLRDTATITQPSAPVSSTFTQVNVLCNGGATGSINLTPTGGTTPYTYAWTGPGSFTATTEDISSLAAGTYSVVITDANGTAGGCRATNSVTITQPSAPVSSTFTQVNVLCNGGATGSINLTPAGGTTPYTYAWTGPGSFTATTEDISSLAAGTYSVVITDANGTAGGCRATNSVTITQPSAPVSSTFTQVNVLCNGGATGSINLTPTGGTTPYTYAWTGPGSFTATTEDISSLAAGTYSVVITDANGTAGGCRATNSVTITQPSAPVSSTFTQVNVLCNGGATGSINLTPAGGTTPYTYAWTGPGSFTATTEDISSLSAGTYSVVITDANGTAGGCRATNSVTITEPTQLVISNTVTDVKCFGEANGAVNVTVSGGVTPYVYSWSNGPTSEDNLNVIAGSYTLTVTDNNGCTIQTTGDVKQPALLTATHVITKVKCFGGSDGGVNLTVAGGITPYVYSWTGGDITEDIAAKPTGTYNVVVTDKNLCTVADVAFISQPLAPLSSSIVMTPVNCYNGSDGIANLTMAGGTAPYTFLWSNAKTTEDISGLVIGKYNVTVKDSNNCQLLDSVVLTQPAAPLATILTAQDVKCFGGNDGSVNLTVTGGTTPYTFAWNNLAITEDISNLTFGKYVVTITDKNLCVIKDSINVGQPSAPLSSIINQSSINCFGGNDGGVTLNVSGGTLNYSYLWSNGATTKDITGLVTGKYKVTVIDGNNCSLLDSIVVLQPTAPIAVTHVVSNAKCKNSTDGGINLTVTGGTSPYIFAWSNGQTSEDAVNLGDGHYVVTITDKNGCLFKDSADITEPDSLLISANGTPATEGENNGYAFVNVIGGTLPYSFFWNGGIAGNDTLFNRPSGTNIIKVIDGNGCTQSDTFIILVAPPTSALRIGPNPSNGILTVFDLETFGLDIPITFELYDLEGQLQFTFEIIGKHMHTFNIPDHLFNGLYTLRMYNIRYEENRKINLLR